MKLVGKNNPPIRPQAKGLRFFQAASELSIAIASPYVMMKNTSW
jgi:hypothetical protein